jgi:hypothetical protein
MNKTSKSEKQPISSEIISEAIEKYGDENKEIIGRAIYKISEYYIENFLDSKDFDEKIKKIIKEEVGKENLFKINLDMIKHFAFITMSQSLINDFEFNISKFEVKLKVPKIFRAADKSIDKCIQYIYNMFIAIASIKQKVAENEAS